MVITMRKRGECERGFTAIELMVVALVLVLIISFMFPRMASLISKTRFESAKRDAAYIGAVIERMKIEGIYDPDDAGINEIIREKSGTEYPGYISELMSDGSFAYSLAIGDVVYKVYFNPQTCGVYEAP